MKKLSLIQAFISLIFLFALPVNSQNGFDYVAFGIRMAGGISKMSSWENYTNRFPGTNIKIEEPYSLSDHIIHGILE